MSLNINYIGCSAIKTLPALSNTVNQEQNLNKYVNKTVNNQVSEIFKKINTESSNQNESLDSHLLRSNKPRDLNQLYETLEKKNSDLKEQLSQEIALMQQGLIEISHNVPKEKLANWTDEIDGKCHTIKEMEERISSLMNQVRDAFLQDEEQLKNYGPKHSNIVKMDRLREGLDLKDINVPIPHGIASDTVEEFLRIHAPSVFKEWDALNLDYSKYKKNSHSEKENLRFLETPGTQLHLDHIMGAIKEAFIKAGSDEKLYSLLLSDEFIKWLDSVHAKNDYLMVRSTGSEDSRQSANAGGNLSKAYVSATMQDFCKASGEVIASYFSYSSLQNRINAEENPFEQELKLAVTSQQLIGEPIGGTANDIKDIPISLVLFTSEPLYTGGENFRTMRISATYGHGEGVVGEQGIACDTVLLLLSEANPDKLYVMYDNKEKPFRLAPVQTPEGITASCQSGRITENTCLDS